MASTLIEFELGVSRFRNIGAVTCYMNSILHILQQTPIFYEFITQYKFYDNIKHLSKEQINKLITFELFKLFRHSHENDNSVIVPNNFYEKIGKKNSIWAEHQQQDSQEFLIFLLSTIEEEIGNKVIFLPGLWI